MTTSMTRHVLLTTRKWAYILIASAIVLALGIGLSIGYAAWIGSAWEAKIRFIADETDIYQLRIWNSAGERSWCQYIIYLRQGS